MKARRAFPDSGPRGAAVGAYARSLRGWHSQRRVMRPSLLVVLASLPAVCSFAGGQDDADLSGLERAQRARSADPDDPGALEAVARAFEADGDVDGHVAYLLLAADAVDQTEYDDEAAKEQRLEALVAEIDELGAGLKSIRKARDSYLSDLTWALRLYAGNQNKQRNALAVGARILDYRPDHPRASRELRALRKELAPELQAEARRLLGQKDLRRPRKFLLEWARTHERWADAGQFEGDRYAVKTNAGYDVGQVAVKSLEAIAEYYERFYGVDRSLVRRLTPVNICRTHEEFKEIANYPRADNPGLLAFIRKIPRINGDGDVELEFEVFGYDPRAFGRPLDGLWSTLWHEASHEYMGLVTEERVAPLWINEGMSSYFEGVTFSEKAEIGVGLPAFGRLGPLIGMIERGDRPLRATIEAIGSLTAEQYSVAWGVVYHLIHGRDGRGRLLRPDALPTAMKLLGERMVTGPGLFDEVVLGDSGLTLEEFEAEWVAAMQALAASESDPVARASELVLAAAGRAEAGDAADALGLYEQALLRDPMSISALAGLSELHHARWKESRKRDDQAADETLLWARRLRDVALALDDEDTSAAADELCREVDRAGHKKIARAEARYRERVDKVLEKLLEEGRPRTAVALAELFLDAVLGTSVAMELAVGLRVDDIMALERPVEMFDGRTLEGINARKGVFTVEEGTITGTAPRPQPAGLFLERPVAPTFRFEGFARLGDSNTVLSIVASSPEGGVFNGFTLRPSRVKGVDEPPREFRPFDEARAGRIQTLTQRDPGDGFGPRYDLVGRARKAPVDLDVDRWFHFALTHDSPGLLTLQIDGEPAGEFEFAPTASSASVGLLLYGGEGSFMDLVVYELDRL